MVLGAFFYGYIFTMLPGGYLAERYSAKWVIFLTVSLASLCSILSPVSAKLGGYGGFIAVKVIQGFVQVLIFKAACEGDFFLAGSCSPEIKVEKNAH